MASSLIDRVRSLLDTVVVPQNGVAIAFWPPAGTTRVLATEALNGCTGVGIISRHAGILAHIAPFPPDRRIPSKFEDPGRQNLVLKLQEVIHLYDIDRTYFPQAESFTVVAFYRGALANAEAEQMARNVLGGLGLPVTARAYNALDPGTIRASGETSIVIVAAGDEAMPTVYVNDQALDS